MRCCLAAAAPEARHGGRQRRIGADHRARLDRLAAERGEKKLRLDAVKVSHHGSRGNTTRSFLDQIDCDTYLVSTDGSHFGHPDDEAIDRILDRGAPETRLVFNYRSERNAKWANEDTQRARRYTAFYPRSIMPSQINKHVGYSGTLRATSSLSRSMPVA